MDLQQRRGKNHENHPALSRLAISYCILIFLFSCLPLAAEPWGKDADLTWRPSPKKSAPDTCQTMILGSVGELLIAFHQEIISPADGPRSHYFPSSSQYTLEAMRRYGFLRGYIMGCDRLMRENSDPWIYPVRLDPSGTPFKYNPVK